jgi:hypothetical protein
LFLELYFYHNFAVLLIIKWQQDENKNEKNFSSSINVRNIN